jgi:hypothetical protein
MCSGFEARLTVGEVGRGLSKTQVSGSIVLVSTDWGPRVFDKAFVMPITANVTVNAAIDIALIPMLILPGALLSLCSYTKG